MYWFQPSVVTTPPVPLRAGGAVLQHQAVVGRRTTVDDAGRGQIHRKRADLPGHADTGGIDAGTRHGGEGVAGDRTAQVHTAVDGSCVEEGIAGPAVAEPWNPMRPVMVPVLSRVVCAPP